MDLKPNSFDQYKSLYSESLLLDLYVQLLKPRMIEEKMLLLLRQGKISKWFSGIGQEAIAVGCTAGLDMDEKIFPMHRNLGVFTSRKMPLDRLFCQWQGKKNGYTKGRDRSFHFGDPAHHVIGMISHLGPQLSLAAGVALAYKLQVKNKVSLAFTGDGATSQGEFHEALNTAAVWKLPVIFVIENNGYGLSTPNDEQFLLTHLAERGHGYGILSATIDGNNILEVYNKIREIKQLITEEPQPFLLECMTFRMRGHEEASGTKYVPSELFEIWKQKDPLDTYEKFLIEQGFLSQEKIEVFRSEIKNEIDVAWKYTENQEEIVPDTSEEVSDVFAPFVLSENNPPSEAKEMRYIDAISSALDQAMHTFPNLILMGQDIAEYGGAFKITQGLVDKYSKTRVRNTPLCESAIIGISLGLSLENYKSMVEMQFADFVTCGFNQIVNNLAKLHYRWRGNADVVIRMPAGGGVAAGPFHSQCNEAWFTHTPGLKVVFPSSAFDAKGLLLAAFEDINPVIFFEHKAMYRTISDEVPEGYYTIPLGQARKAREGNRLSIITYGMGVHWSVAALDKLGIEGDVIDLRTLVPMDYASIDESVKKTGRALIVHEDTMFGGIGGEIAAYISEHLFQYLDAPIKRVASLDTPVPFSAPLELNFMANARLIHAIEKIVSY